VYCFGHWHKDQGVTELGGKQFINIGSLTRGSLSQDEVQRRPACAILKCSDKGVEVDVVRLKVAPAEEVFDVDKREREVRQQNDMDSFINNIKDSLTEQDDSTDVREAIRSTESVPQEIRERAILYLERADG
jgi:exonuclease SbcC